MEHQSHRITASDDAKNVRPRLLEKELQGVGTDLSTEQQALLSVPIEMVHAWSKQVDDMHDGDDTRNGVRAPHAYMSDKGLSDDASEDVTGNHLRDVRSRGYRPVSDLDIDEGKKFGILEVIWDAEEDLAVGQNYDILNTESVRSEDFDERELAYGDNEYDRLAFLDEINEKKTAALFRAMGEIVETVEGLETDALSNYGTALGKAYQIRDNIIDITADEQEQGRTPFSDLEEGTYTEPIHLAESYLESMETRERNRSNLEKAGEYGEKASFIREVMENPSPDAGELGYAAEIITEDTPAIEASQNLADYWVDQATGNEEAEIDGYLGEVDWEDESYRRELEELAVYAGRLRGS